MSKWKSSLQHASFHTSLPCLGVQKPRLSGIQCCNQTALDSMSHRYFRSHWEKRTAASLQQASQVILLVWILANTTEYVRQRSWGLLGLRANIIKVLFPEHNFKDASVVAAVKAYREIAVFIGFHHDCVEFFNFYFLSMVAGHNQICLMPGPGRPSYPFVSKSQNRLLLIGFCPFKGISNDRKSCLSAGSPCWRASIRYVLDNYVKQAVPYWRSWRRPATLSTSTTCSSWSIDLTSSRIKKGTYATETDIMYQ